MSGIVGLPLQDRLPLGCERGLPTVKEDARCNPALCTRPAEASGRKKLEGHGVEVKLCERGFFRVAAVAH